MLELLATDQLWSAADTLATHPEDLVLDAYFPGFDLGAFCRLDELRFERLVNGPTRIVLEYRVTRVPRRSAQEALGRRLGPSLTG